MTRTRSPSKRIVRPSAGGPSASPTMRAPRSRRCRRTRCAGRRSPGARHRSWPLRRRRRHGAGAGTSSGPRCAGSSHVRRAAGPGSTGARPPQSLWPAASGERTISTHTSRWSELGNGNTPGQVERGDRPAPARRHRSRRSACRGLGARSRPAGCRERRQRSRRCRSAGCCDGGRWRLPGVTDASFGSLARRRVARVDAPVVDQLLDRRRECCRHRAGRSSGRRRSRTSHPPAARRTSRSRRRCSRRAPGVM